MTAIPTTPLLLSAAAPSPPPHAPRLPGGGIVWPLTLDQYHRMIAAGILGEDDPVELIDGYLVAKDRGRGPGMGHGPQHAWGVGRAGELLSRTLIGLVIRCQLPITLPPPGPAPGGSEPEPDIVVADGPEHRYVDHHPGPGEIRLVTEVADSSLAFDRRQKAPLYAAANIPLYWIINLTDRQLEVYSAPDPAAAQYRSRQVLTEDQQAVLSWPGLAPVTFPVRDFLP